MCYCFDLALRMLSPGTKCSRTLTPKKKIPYSPILTIQQNPAAYFVCTLYNCMVSMYGMLIISLSVRILFEFI